MKIRRSEKGKVKTIECVPLRFFKSYSICIALKKLVNDAIFANKAHTTRHIHKKALFEDKPVVPKDLIDMSRYLDISSTES